MLQTFIHYFLHLIFPILLAKLFYPKQWKKAYLIMLSTMLVDLDHLLADPIFDPERCSIGYHPLHSYWACFVYILMLFFKAPIRIAGIGLVLHMLTDSLDCWLMKTL